MEAAGWTLSFCSKAVGPFFLEIFLCQLEQVFLPGHCFHQDSLDAHKYMIIHIQCVALSRQGQILVPCLQLEAGFMGEKVR